MYTVPRASFIMPVFSGEAYLVQVMKCMLALTRHEGKGSEASSNRRVVGLIGTAKLAAQLLLQM